MPNLASGKYTYQLHLKALHVSYTVWKCFSYDSQDESEYLHKQQLRLMFEGTKTLRNIGNYSPSKAADHSGKLKFREKVCFL